MLKWRSILRAFALQSNRSHSFSSPLNPIKPNALMGMAPVKININRLKSVTPIEGGKEGGRPKHPSQHKGKGRSPT
jgi:hypothetical protein